MPFREIPVELRNSSSDTSTDSNDLPPSMKDEEGVGAAGQMQLSSEPPPDSAELPALQFNEPSLQRFSFDFDESEECKHWPRGVTEPELRDRALEELLILVTGRTDLQNVESVRLHLIPNMIRLSCLPSFLPRLVSLDLSGSVLHSLRDLGCSLLNLTHLNVTSCGLRNFDGTSGFPGLQVLIADGNMVQLVGPLVDLLFLKRLSARHNRISDLAMLAFLGMCPNLVQLELQGNPVTHSVLYRLTLQRCVSSLEMLDGEPLWMGAPENKMTRRMIWRDVGQVVEEKQEEEMEVEMEDDDEEEEEKSLDLSASSLSSADNYSSAAPSDVSNFGVVLNFGDAPARPATTCGIETEPGNQPHIRRVASACSLTSNKRPLLSARSPMAGSVLDMVRQRKRPRLPSSRSDTAISSNSLSLNEPLNHFLYNNHNNNRTKDNYNSMYVLQPLPPLSTPPQSLMNSSEEVIFKRP